MIAAHLIGWTVALPLDSEVGATFVSTPPGWGLHLIDVPLGQGDLVSLAERQAEKWLSE